MRDGKHASENMLVKTLAKSLDSIIPESRIFYVSYVFKFDFCHFNLKEP